MINFIHEKQLKSNLKRYGYKSSDEEVGKLVNDLQHKVVGDLLKEVKKVHQKVQKGGRVSFPIDYFGGQTNNLSIDAPSFTNISADATNLRQIMPLNDPTGSLSTENAMQSVMLGGGKKQKFELSQTAARESVKHLISQEDIDIKDSKEFTKISKQKFEYVMDEVLNKAKKSDKSGHLTKETLKKVLQQKKYNSFKA